MTAHLVQALRQPALPVVLAAVAHPHVPARRVDCVAAEVRMERRLGSGLARIDAPVREAAVAVEVEVGVVGLGEHADVVVVPLRSRAGRKSEER